MLHGEKVSAVPSAVTFVASAFRIAAKANALPRVTLVIRVVFISTIGYESVNGELVVSLVKKFLGKSQFSIGIAFVTETAEKMALVAVAKAVGVAALGRVVKASAHIAVEINSRCGSKVQTYAWSSPLLNQTKNQFSKA